MQDMWEKVLSVQCRPEGMIYGSGGIGPAAFGSTCCFSSKGLWGRIWTPLLGVRGAPPGSQIGVQIDAEMVPEGSILRSKFDPKSRPQNETEKLAY